MDSVSLFVAHHINSNRPSAWGYGWTIGTGDLAGLDTKLLALGHLFHDLPTIFFRESQCFTSSMNGCPDTLWAAANSREERSDGAWPRMDFLGLQKGLISI